MARVATGLLNLCLTVAEIIVAIGLLTALCRVALGHRRAYAQLVGVGFAVLVLVLWERGQLGAIVQGAASYLTSTAAAPGPGLPFSTPAAGTGR
jgi:hypothetical protein